MESWRGGGGRAGRGCPSDPFRSPPTDAPDADPVTAPASQTQAPCTPSVSEESRASISYEANE